MKPFDQPDGPISTHPLVGIVVEDMPATREWLADAMQQAFPGIRIHTAATISQAKMALARYADNLGERSALALIDLCLPDGSGLEVVRLSSEQGIMPVVVTIYGDDDSLFEAMKAGAQGYLLKDHPLVQLVHYLRRISQGEPPLSPSVAHRILSHLRDPLAHRPGHACTGRDLSPREIDVLRLIGRGLRVPEVSTELGVSEHTVAGYIKNIYRKLKISSRAEAAIEASRRRLL